MPEAVLFHIVPCAEDKGIIDLFQRLRGVNLSLWHSLLLQCMAAVKHYLCYFGTFLFQGKPLLSPPRVMEAGAKDTVHIHISHNQILFKSPAPRYNIHLLVYNHALAVKYKLILTATHVYISNNHTIIRRPRADHFFPEPRLSHMVWRGIYIYYNLSACNGLHPCRPFRIPYIFAYAYTELNIFQYYIKGHCTCLEIPVLIKNTVVRQKHLVVNSRYLAFMDNCGRIIYILFAVNKADDSSYTPCFTGY